MINSNVYDYVNIMKTAADASWIRDEVISNNIANATTPGYKREDVDFEGTLRRALGDSRYTTMDAKVRNALKKDLKPRTYVDSASFSYRLDGNNVDPDTEGVYLAANQLKYEGIMKAINFEFQNMQTAMKG
ncbi:flagellar basal body rod protein FlgB [Butyrivibrio sp. NC3005]|uniref:flagellar basal body rod protein FlgB n=1 Tax=Butyrivibrio sp. NC3005 TaxID=1280685 RepID=UPI0003F9F92A|nr:flagellar basal body rod protein FlgB [Butyrivibrio sp. NC3005]